MKRKAESGEVEQIAKCAKTERSRHPDSTLLRFEKFMDLPMELRQQVYTFTCADSPKSITIDNIRPSHPFPSFLPSICYASATVYHEATPIYLQQVKFILKNHLSIDALTLFLRHVSNSKGFSNVRSIMFEYLQEYAMAPGIWRVPNAHTLPKELVERLPALKHLTIEVSAFRFLQNGSTHRLVRRSFQDFLKESRIEEVFECTTLESIQVNCVNADLYCDVLRCTPLEIFDEFMKWFKDEVKKKEGKLKGEVRMLSFGKRNELRRMIRKGRS